MPEGCYICQPNRPTEGLEDPCDACEQDWMEYVYAILADGWRPVSADHGTDAEVAE